MGKIQLSNTQAQLAKRALQLCEKVKKGTSSKLAGMVERKTKRTVRRAKRKMHKKKRKAAMKKLITAKVTKKVSKLTKKKVSPKCKACMKLTKDEHKLLGADC